MKQPKLRVITPVWAQQFGIKRQGNTLFITGWGRIPDPVNALGLRPEQVSKLDIFQRFHNYVLRNLSEKQATEDAGVYQFADATTDEKLIAFVEDLAPCGGRCDLQSTKKTGLPR